MYCSSCGTALTQNLIYCNRCGAKLSDAAKDDGSRASEIPPAMLVCAMVATFVFGMAAVAAFLSVAKGGDPIGIVVLALTFLLILVLESIFTWLLFRGKKVVKAVSAPNQLDEQPRKELYTAPAAGMLADPIPSVTEQTTGLLEPVQRDRKSKELNNKSF
ncbi:MAG TPA: hypothetical protein VF596_08225 [Pyrinomonadaceae bacterium]|jgi:hypothetical protein